MNFRKIKSHCWQLSVQSQPLFSTRFTFLSLLYPHGGYKNHDKPVIFFSVPQLPAQIRARITIYSFKSDVLSICIMPGVKLPLVALAITSVEPRQEELQAPSSGAEWDLGQDAGRQQWWAKQHQLCSQRNLCSELACQSQLCVAKLLYSLFIDNNIFTVIPSTLSRLTLFVILTHPPLPGSSNLFSPNPTVSETQFPMGAPVLGMR